jgi:hypothetical protein
VQEAICVSTDVCAVVADVLNIYCLLPKERKIAMVMVASLLQFISAHQEDGTHGSRSGNLSAETTDAFYVYVKDNDRFFTKALEVGDNDFIYGWIETWPDSHCKVDVIKCMQAFSKNIDEGNVEMSLDEEAGRGEGRAGEEAMRAEACMGGGGGMGSACSVRNPNEFVDSLQGEVDDFGDLGDFGLGPWHGNESQDMLDEMHNYPQWP